MELPFVAISTAASRASSHQSTHWAAIFTALFAGVAGIGAVAAAVFTGRDLSQSRRQTLIANDQLTMQRQREVREQASRIVVYLSRSNDDSVVVHIANNSLEPAYEVEYQFLRHVEGAQARLASPSSLPLLLPPSDDLSRTLTEFVFEPPTTQYTLAVSFRDSANAWWMREANGVLSGPFANRPAFPT